VRRKRKKNLEVVLLFEGLVHETCLLAIWNQRFATHFGKEDFSAAAKPEVAHNSYEHFMGLSSL